MPSAKAHRLLVASANTSGPVVALPAGHNRLRVFGDEDATVSAATVIVNLHTEALGRSFSSRLGSLDLTSDETLTAEIPPGACSCSVVLSGYAGSGAVHVIAHTWAE